MGGKREQKQTLGQETVRLWANSGNLSRKRGCERESIPTDHKEAERELRLSSAEGGVKRIGKANSASAWR